MKYTINVKAKVIKDPPNNQTNPSITFLPIILPPYILSRGDLKAFSINLNRPIIVYYFILFLLLAFLFLDDFCTVYTSCLNVSCANARPVRNLLILSPPLLIISTLSYLSIY